MRVALFIPCYIDQLYPDVGRAALRLLRHHGLDVDYPPAQTCCGQPLANAGATADAKAVAEHFLATFAGYDAVVCPSGSCTAMVRCHYAELVGNAGGHVRATTYELCEFLVDVLKVEAVDGAFPHRVGLHQSCHGLRELRLASSSERMTPPFSKVRGLLASLRDIELVDLERADECCGFGGSFAVTEEAVSCRMGNDRIANHEQAGAEIVTSVDMSCLMHLDGLARRQDRAMKFMHVAEVLAEATTSRTRD